MAQPYNQTILLDANRLSSEEYSASNLAQTDNAVFTNKVSNGVTLDIGDQVSIQSAHIAQRGAGGSVIQMDGKVLGQKEVNYTQTTNSSYIGFFQVQTNEPYSPTGYAYETSENVSENVKIKDNEASVIFSYYKTANGENNIGLPRNFGSASMGSSVHGGDPSGGGISNASFWNASDSFAKGCNTFHMAASHTLLDDYLTTDGMNACGSVCKIMKVKQDNSKFTLFKRTPMGWKAPSMSSASLEHILKPLGQRPDPAIAEYIRFKQKVTLGTKVGYNSPSSISTDITDTLLDTDNPVKIIDTDSTSSFVNSTLYKAFPCANYENMSVTNASSFFNTGVIRDNLPILNPDRTPVVDQSSLNYISNYAYVGFKRPDFVEAGRNIFAYHGNRVNVSITRAEGPTAIIKTNLTYNDGVCQKLKRFFDSQPLYPELFDYATDPNNGITNYSTYNTTSASLNASFREEARFLHIGISGFGGYAHQLSSNESMGSDNYNVSFSNASALPPNRTNASDNSSNPIFIYYNKNSSDSPADTSHGTRKDNLAYGFALNVGGLIAFMTEPIGGIPDSYFSEQTADPDQINVDTKIGYDYHFNAYGNAAIILSSGFHPLQYYGHQRFSDGQSIRQVYCGANNCLFNFNNNESRFELSNLHSPEKVGNFYNAGDPSPAADTFGPPPTAQSGNDCFKINKQLKYDSWSPCMQPYSEIDLTTTGAAPNSTQKTFIDVNVNLSLGVVYDSHGGVVIEDMGVTEDKWSDSIWGLLGFEYGQFNASGDLTTINNYNYRITNDTVNVSGVTTNANITSSTGQEFFTNVFGINMFNCMVESEAEYFTAKKNIAQNLSNPNNTVPPTIVVGDVESTKIRAKQIPRKLLKGYFLINSDILDSANYYQLANPLQTMAVVGKYNGANDFVNYDGGGPVFTVTRKKTITSIKTQILDPDGSLAQVGDNSGIIYRIDKQIKTDLHFAENLLAGQYGKPPQ